MATQTQYDFFKYLYDAEQTRYRELIDRGKLFLSIITIYLGLLAVAADKTIPLSKHSLIIAITYTTSVIFIVGAMVPVVLAVGVFKYERPSDPMRIVENFGREIPIDEEFLDARLVDFAVATERNFSQNEKRANLLRVSSFILLLGAIGQAVFFIQFIFF